MDEHVCSTEQMTLCASIYSCADHPHRPSSHQQTPGGGAWRGRGGRRALTVPPRLPSPVSLPGLQAERERFISSHDIGCIFSYKLRYFRQTCGAYMVNTDLLPAAPQIGILSSFFLVELPDSKSQLMEQIVLSIMVFCLGGSHQSLKIFCFNLKKVFKNQKEIIKTRYALRRCLTGTENRGNPARPSRRKLNPVFIIILIIILIIITKIKI